MGRVSEAQINEAIANFDYEGKLLSKEPFGSGHINDTYLLKYEISEMGILKVILQRMNREIFTNPVELMENVVGVTTFLWKKRCLQAWLLFSSRMQGRFVRHSAGFPLTFRYPRA